MTDTELLDALEAAIRKNGYVFLHNLRGSDDPKWPAGYNGPGIGLIPQHPRTLRSALETALSKPVPKAIQGGAR